MPTKYACVPDRWSAQPDPVTGLAHAIRHHVVSQIIRPEIAAFLSPGRVAMKALRDAQCCVVHLKKSDQGPIEAADAEFAKSLPHLTTVDLSDRTVTALEFAHIAAIQQLRHLLMRRCSVYSAGLSYLPQLSSLVELDLSFSRWVDPEGSVKSSTDTTPLREEFFAAISKLSELDTLCLSGCHGVTEAALQHLSKLPLLRALFLASCLGVGADVSCLAALPRLAFLDLRGCVNANSDNLPASVFVFRN